MRSFDRLYIGGEWVEPASSSTFTVVNPATLEPVGSTPEAVQADVDRAVEAARSALNHGPWAEMSAQDRAGIMRRLHGLMVERADDLANLITQEVGAPILFSHFGQIGATHMALDFFTGLTESYPFEEVRAGMLGPVVVRKEPVGVVAGIVPWNVPLFITMLKFAPTLASGSTMVLKPAPETPVSAFVFAELCEEAGVPAGVLNVVPADREVGEHLVTHPGVDKVSFTGSTAAGRHIGALCGERLRRCTLELGGKRSARIGVGRAELDAARRELEPVAREYEQAKRAAADAMPRAQPASFSARVTGVAGWVSVRPTITVSRWVSARSHSDDTAAEASATIRSTAARATSARAESRVSCEVAPRCSQCAASSSSGGCRRSSPRSRSAV